MGMGMLALKRIASLIYHIQQYLPGLSFQILSQCGERALRFSDFGQQWICMIAAAALEERHKSILLRRGCQVPQDRVTPLTQADVKAETSQPMETKSLKKSPMKKPDAYYSLSNFLKKWLDKYPDADENVKRKANETREASREAGQKIHDILMG
jgi:hypothetical protein